MGTVDWREIAEAVNEDVEDEDEGEDEEQNRQVVSRVAIPCILERYQVGSMSGYNGWANYETWTVIFNDTRLRILRSNQLLHVRCYPALALPYHRQTKGTRQNISAITVSKSILMLTKNATN